jgi:hypothetical protein
MDKDVRNAIERATQKARRILEEDFAEQLDATYDVRADGRVAEKGGAHLTGRQHLLRDKIVAAIEHKRSAAMKPTEAVADYIRDAAFTALNRFVALKMLEARELVQECISRGDGSSGFVEFCGLAPAIKIANGAGYRLYIESIFDELSTEVKVLFDRRDAASVLWPKKATFDELLAILNADELKGVWNEDETIGWVYQYFNSGEERRKMREENQAPQNSRELAIRNQFFTPRYVVQFLCDNTLGRIWYEMRNGDTRLAGFCEYMVRTPKENVRTKKDPRDIRIIDPACGSGHFLLYCFILLLLIYEEAWADETAPKSGATGGTLRHDYPSLGELQKAVPELILLHNLHGVDIDPRCAQIAQLALWMRAQRAFKEAGIPRAERPIIRRANIVLAEPMPGERKLVEEFAATLRPAIIGNLFEEIVSEMRLAGEMGPLLQIERKLAISIERARVAFTEQQKHGEGFLPGMAPIKRQTELDLSGIDNSAFFEKAEEQIFASLKKFVSDATNGRGTRRQLFADDAEQGIAFVELMGSKFDVVLMNPPFGDPTKASKEFIFSSYPNSKTELYACFIDRAIQLAPRGFVGCLCSRTGFFLTSLEKWRRQSLLRPENPSRLFIDLGSGVLDAAVECACIVIGGTATSVRCADVAGKVKHLDSNNSEETALRSVVRNSEFVDVSLEALSALPGATFAFRLPSVMRGLFAELPSLADRGFVAKQGIGTSDNFRFLRLRWEISTDIEPPTNWMRYAKGGAYAPFFSDSNLLVNWGADGHEIKAYSAQLYGTWSKQITNTQYFGSMGLTYASRTHREFAPALLPPNSAFDTKGCCIFSSTPRTASDWHCLLGYLNSRCFSALLRVGLSRVSPGLARQYTESLVTSVPIPDLRSNSPLDHEVQSAIALHKEIENSRETATEFDIALWIDAIRDKGVKTAIDFLHQQLKTTWEKQVQTAARIDLVSTDAYFGQAPANEITSFLDTEIGVVPTQNSEALSSGFWNVVRSSAYFDQRSSDAVERQRIAARLISVLFGCAIGRWPRRPGVVDDQTPTPPTDISSILSDDAGKDHDVIDVIELFIANLIGERQSEALRSLCSVAYPEDLDPRYAIRKHFFEDHINDHSLDKRKAPIYWQIATPSASYSVWMYIHAFTKDTLFRVENEYVAPKFDHERRQLQTLRTEVDEQPTSAQRKAIESQERLLEEIRALLEDVRRVAPLWKPNHHDGVMINAAPLWRLFPQHKAWQNEVKSTWAALCRGDYDWAHLAIHLWPERVIPKCAEDRSLAIAHGLEDVFWFEDEDGKWKANEKPQKSIAELISERTSTAVKAALKSLLDASEPASGAKRNRKSKAA